MPEISRFYGIVIAMYANDHPPAHFHASYGEFECVIGIDRIELIDGGLPPRALALAIEWAAMHQAELATAWKALRAGQSPQKIEPLK